jgi:two-component system, OmpR family, sensor histidine kinase KdpD
VVPHRVRSPLRLSSGLGAKRQLVSAAAAVIVLSLLTSILQAHRGDVSLTIVFLLYLGVVVALAAAGGPLVGVCVAIVAFLVVNWFFTEPVHTLNVSDPERLAELIIFLAVSGTVASLVDTATRRQEVLDVTTAENEELTAANDLRTPLTTAKLATSSLLADDIVLPDAQRTELLQLADQEIDRLIGIVENLLDAGRLQAGALTVDVVSVSLRQLAERVVTTASDDHRARITNAVRGDVAEVRGDLALLERVVANLVTNALTADHGNPIEICAGDQPDGRVGLDVVDHGPGLSVDQRDAAFRPFHRFEDRGSSAGIGLGLPICAGFCDAMGAELVLFDTPGGGLTARILLERAA